jgi:hypothetical protein
MNARQLIKILQQYNPETSVMIYDGFNGGGAPRDLNYGPAIHKITAQDAEATADCENREGQDVIIIGFGSY